MAKLIDGWTCRLVNGQRSAVNYDTCEGAWLMRDGRLVTKNELSDSGEVTVPPKVLAWLIQPLLHEAWESGHTVGVGPEVMLPLMALARRALEDDPFTASAIRQHERDSERFDAGFTAGSRFDVRDLRHSHVLPDEVDEDPEQEPESRPQSQGVPTVTREHESAAFAICANIAQGYSGIPAGLMGDVCDALAYQIAQKEAAYERGRSQAAGDGWVSASESVPEVEREVLIYYRLGLSSGRVVGKRTYGSGNWYSSGFPLRNDDVVAWAPLLPAPPSDSGKVECPGPLARHYGEDGRRHVCTRKARCEARVHHEECPLRPDPPDSGKGE